MSEVDATVVRPFEDDAGFHRAGKTISLSTARFADLRANGLVAERDKATDAVKTAPTPANKMVPDPAPSSPQGQPSKARSVKAGD